MAAGIAGVVLILSLICCKTIRIACAVIKQSVVVIGLVPMIFLFPFVTLLILIIHLGWSLPAAYLMYLSGAYDSSTNTYNFETITRDASFLLITTTNYYQILWYIVLVFGVIWGATFLYGMLEYTITAVIVIWYFNRDKTRKGMKGSLKKACNHGMKSMGTIAVTSFITALVILIRFIFEYVLKRLERANKLGDSKVVKAAIVFTRYCLLVI